MLGECLASLSFVDEIVVLDGGSSDGTVEIARRYTDKIIVNADWQGYGMQRQRAQNAATGDWILMIDADERVTPELEASIRSAVEGDQRNVAYSMAILPWCFGRFLRHGGWYPAPKVRLYARKKARYGEERVHEKLYFDADVKFEQLKGDLLHFTYRDLEHYLVKSARYAAEFATQRQQRGKSTSLLTGVLHGIGCFMRMYFIKVGFLDGKQGLLMALLSAHSTFVKYADLWSRQQPSKATRIS